MPCFDGLIPTALQDQCYHPIQGTDPSQVEPSKGAPNQCDSLSLEMVCVVLARARKCTGFILHTIEFSWHFLHSKTFSVKEYDCDWHAGPNSLSSHRGNTVSSSGWKRSGPMEHSFTHLFKNTRSWASLSHASGGHSCSYRASSDDSYACQVPAICQALI